MISCRVTARSALYEGCHRFSEVASIRTASGSVSEACGPLDGCLLWAAGGSGATTGALLSRFEPDGQDEGLARWASVAVGIFTRRRGASVHRVLTRQARQSSSA